MRGPPDTFSKPENVSAPVVHNNSTSATARFEVSGASDGETSVDAQALLEEYGWMINSDECDREIWAELEQEEQLQELYERACQEEEDFVYFNQSGQQRQRNPQQNGNSLNRSNNNMDAAVANAENQMEKLTVEESTRTTANTTNNTPTAQERLNPNATEFIPRSRRSTGNN